MREDAARASAVSDDDIGEEDDDERDWGRGREAAASKSGRKADYLSQRLLDD